MRIAVIQAHRRAHTVFIVFRAPAAARMADVRPEKSSRRRVETVRVHRAQIGIMSGDRALGTSGSERAKDRIAYRHWHGHPDEHRRWFYSAHHPSGRKNDVERPKRTVVDRKQQRGGNTLEHDFGGGAAGGDARVVKSRHLRAYPREIDGHSVATHFDTHFDRNRFE